MSDPAPPAKSPPHVLDGGLIVETVERLQARISERFPGSGLASVCADLTGLARRAHVQSQDLARPYWGLRIAVGGVLAAALGLLGWHLSRLRLDDVARASLVEMAQGTDATVNLLLLAAAGAWFFLTMETRMKRGRVHAALTELRAVAHVIDMHQLTKDPALVVGGGEPTRASLPRRAMTEFELARYLDYCAEMLALIAKLAALYQVAQTDPEIGADVTEVERLTSDLGRKIWQKITIIGRLSEARPPTT